ncbi:MAG: hypothetical protein IJ867_08130 [Clostridia bacterium]|nr:hypothetical protein [Clostridia bacterium]
MEAFLTKKWPSGYIIRDEEILKGDNSSAGITQIVTEGTRVSKGEAVFRYYANNEEEITKQIEELDKQIDQALVEENNISSSPDIASLEAQIKQELDNIFGENNLENVREYQKRINNYTVKKGEIAGNLSPEGSTVRNLVETRTALSRQLTSDSETIYSPKPGIISYKVDGLEDEMKLNNNDFSYLTSSFLEDLQLNVLSSIPESKEVGKIINNYNCYIACPMDSENSETCEVGDKVVLRLPDSSEVNGEIVQINEEKDKRIIIFKIREKVESLLEYRKISLDIIWWKYSGWKVSNSALVEKNDLTYIVRTRAGNKEEILVKVLRQNDTYSIVENYSDDELLELGFDQEKIVEFPKIKLYDEILITK